MYKIREANKNLAIRIILFLLLFAVELFGYNSVKVSSDGIAIVDSGYFKTKQDITSDIALHIATNTKIEKLPKDAKSFGFDDNSFWFYFDVEIKDNDNIYFLDIKNPVSDYCTLYVYQDDKLIETINNGYKIAINDREVQDFPIRFSLHKHKGKLKYLLKINSTNPHYTAFEFGIKNDIVKSWYINYFIMTFTLGVFVALVLYNIFLYIATKDIVYFYYCFYMFGLLLCDICALGYQHFASYYLLDSVPSFIISTSTHSVPLFAFIEFIGLIFFTITFLNIKEKLPNIYKYLRYLLILNFVLLVFFVFGYLKSLFAINLLVMSIVLLYAAIKTALDGGESAKWYLFATSVSIVLVMLFMMTNQGYGIGFDIYTINLLHFAIIWDLIVLSFALAQKYKEMQNQKELANIALQTKAKFVIMGETIGNIAHQWRQPLAELGSIIVHINTHITFYGSIATYEVHKSMQKMEEIVKKLSNTLNTFTNFLSKSNTNSTFALDNTIENVLAFVSGTLSENNIEVTKNLTKGFVVQGEADMFFEALINIINNAQDALIHNNIEKKQIKIELYADNNEAILTIEDNAKGIVLKDIHSIFEPYISTKGLNGMGLGLFMTKNIINRLNGNITVQNIQNGAKFTIKLPIII